MCLSCITVLLWEYIRVPIHGPTGSARDFYTRLESTVLAEYYLRKYVYICTYVAELGGRTMEVPPHDHALGITR